MKVLQIIEECVMAAIPRPRTHMLILVTLAAVPCVARESRRLNPLTRRAIKHPLILSNEKGGSHVVEDL